MLSMFSSASSFDRSEAFPVSKSSCFLPSEFGLPYTSQVQMLTVLSYMEDRLGLNFNTS